MKEIFRKFSRRTSAVMGSPYAFVVALMIVIIWAVTGPLFEFSDTWQLAINTGTTIVTFLMVFLIQNAQNREAKAVQLKLDELIRAVRTAHNKMLALDDLTDEEIEKIEERFKKLAK